MAAAVCAPILGIEGGQTGQDWKFARKSLSPPVAYDKLHELNSDMNKILAPRLPMVILAALTDFYTYRLAGRVLGNGYREAAVSKFTSLPESQLTYTCDPLTSCFYLSRTSSTRTHSRGRSRRPLKRV